MSERVAIRVDGTALSVLRAGDGPPALLLHGTFWSRVWAPVLDAIGARATALALDLPGFGASGGRLRPEDASVPALAATAQRALAAVGVDGPYAVAGHDIGGAVAQHLAAHDERVTRLALVNSVLYDSWPVPAVARFRDPELAMAITPDELVQARATSLGKAVARELSDEERAEYLAPWRDEDRTRSWTALAGAADARFTLDLVEALRRRALPTLLVWGEDDEFQPVAYAERYAGEMPATRLERIPGARHIPMEDAPERVGALLAAFLNRPA